MLREKWELLFRQKTDNTGIQLLRYTFVGGTAYIVDFGLLYIFTEYVGFQYLISAALSFIAGLATNYILSIFWVFKSRSIENKMSEFAIFTIIGLIGLGFNELFMWIFTGLAGWYYLVSKLVTTPLIFLWNFFARKLILFTKKSEQL